MATENRYGQYPAQLNSVTLSQVRDYRVSAGIQKAVIGAGGTINPKYVAKMRQDVLYSVTTTELRRFLDWMATPWQGKGFSSAPSPFAVYFQKHAQFGGRSTSNDFIKISSSDCLVVPRRLSAREGQEATLTFDVLPASTDGITDPFTVNALTANPALAGVVDQLWTCGRMKINTALLDANTLLHIQGVEIDFGIREVRRGGDGLLYATYLGVQEARPSITVTLDDAKAISTLGLGGSPIGASGATIFLTKIAATAAGREAYGTAAHIGFIMTGGFVEVEETSQSGSDQASAQIRLTPIFDNTNPLIAINTAMAIS